MDPKILYWTGAFINMIFVVGLAIAGVRQVKAGQFERHRGFMIAAAYLVLGFLLSYVLKLFLLGREDLGTWTAVAVNTLRFHECCVLVMVVAGGLAMYWGHQLRSTRHYTLNEADPKALDSLLRRHHLAGRSAIAGAILGLLSAGFVLAGMYARLPG